LIKVTPFQGSPQICNFLFEGTLEKCRDLIINFLNRHNIKFQIRKDGLIKCKYDVSGALVSLKFKIDLSNMNESTETNISFTHQQGSLNSFEAIIKMAKTESISAKMNKFSEGGVLCSA
jgi:hypothetical protein